MICLKNKVKPDSNTSIKNWHRVKKSNNKLPFKFKKDHPDRFSPIDWGVWVLYNSTEARKWFSSILIDTFEYNLNALIELTGEMPSGAMEVFSEEINNYPWIRNELRHWGNLFSHLFVSQPEQEPLIYKLIENYYRDWEISGDWILRDLITPKTYKFSELFYQEKLIYILNEEDEEEFDDEELRKILKVDVPNIGTQFVSDNSNLLLLQDGWGFDKNGGLRFL